MKSKTSITLSEDVLNAVNRLAGAGESRSAFIERVLRGYVRRCARAARDERDFERLNRSAEQFNAEVADVLEYQAALPDD